MAHHPDATSIDVISRHTTGLVAVAERADPSTPVPTCGDWTMADLAWHLAEVQAFWAFIIAGRPDAAPQQYDEPDRPDDIGGITAALRHHHGELLTQLASADPSEPAWSWSDDHTVGFTVRRQAHEAVVHHIDAVLAVDAAMPVVAPELAADGVDELVTVMVTGVPDWATFTADGRTVALRCTDADDTWLLGLGRMAGTMPDSRTAYDLPAAEPVDAGTAADVTVAGSALDLLLWAWGRRPLSVLEVGGDNGVAHAFRALVADATA